MFIHHFYKTPIKKKSHTITYDSTLQSPQPNHEQSKARQRINQLYQNFNSLSSTIDVDTNKKHFNLIQYEKEDEKIKYDPQIMTAKLRRLENQAEINRIEMELQQRRKKHRARSQTRQQPNEFQTSTYQQTYQSFLKNSKLIEMPQNDSESEEDDSQQKPKGIARFHQLKKHSKILEYTMKKMKEKEEQAIRQEKEVDERKFEVKMVTNELKDYGEFSGIQRKKTSSMVQVKPQVNPQIIIEDKFKRIMTMKAKDKVSQQVKQNPRCHQMMNLQNDILLQLQQDKKNLSKDNMKKLKSRFIEIVNELHKGDKKRKEIKFLPSLETVSFTAKNTARTTKRSEAQGARLNVEKMSNTFDFKRVYEMKGRLLEDDGRGVLEVDSRFDGLMGGSVGM